MTASDNVGVTGYLVTESSTKPSATAAGWTSAKPASYTFASAGAKTLYAWAKDAAGNVSSSLTGIGHHYTAGAVGHHRADGIGIQHSNNVQYADGCDYNIYRKR